MLVCFIICMQSKFKQCIGSAEVPEFNVVYKNKSQNGIFLSSHAHTHRRRVHRYTKSIYALSLRQNQQKVKPKQFQCQRDATQTYDKSQWPTIPYSLLFGPYGAPQPQQQPKCQPQSQAHSQFPTNRV